MAYIPPSLEKLIACTKSLDRDYISQSGNYKVNYPKLLENTLNLIAAYKKEKGEDANSLREEQARCIIQPTIHFKVKVPTPKERSTKGFKEPEYSEAELELLKEQEKVLLGSILFRLMRLCDEYATGVTQVGVVLSKFNFFSSKPSLKGYAKDDSSLAKVIIKALELKTVGAKTDKAILDQIDDCTKYMALLSLRKFLFDDNGNLRDEVAYYKSKESEYRNDIDSKISDLEKASSYSIEIGKRIDFLQSFTRLVEQLDKKFNQQILTLKEQKFEDHDAYYAYIQENNLPSIFGKAAVKGEMPDIKDNKDGFYEQLGKNLTGILKFSLIGAYLVANQKKTGNPITELDTDHFIKLKSLVERNLAISVDNELDLGSQQHALQALEFLINNEADYPLKCACFGGKEYLLPSVAMLQQELKEKIASQQSASMAI
jgi:hypothetical protein